jgi:ribonuclease P protein component
MKAAAFYQMAVLDLKFSKEPQDATEDVSTEQSAPCEDARLSRTDEDSRRTPSAQSQARQGSQARISRALLVFLGPTLPKSRTFPKQFRLKRATEFQRVYDDGVRKVSRSFVLFAIPNGLNYSRFGFTTPRKLGKAHDRNRIKRRVREILRTSLSEIPTGFDFVLNPRRSAADSDFGRLRKELVTLLGSEK